MSNVSLVINKPFLIKSLKYLKLLSLPMKMLFSERPLISFRYQSWI